ncbi:MAG: threonylcarbamoyl-AMP synthase [Pseudomonadota bacterium]|nr:threonylcarbamoyl-AMP synthase [Pseudomonadota bacterium]
MSQYFAVHPRNPQTRLIRQAAEIVRSGGLLAYPTDSGYALGCHLDDKAAVTRIRAIRGLDDSHHMSLMCRDLAEIARFARVDNSTYRLLKANTPGSYTFILAATKEVPRRLQHPKRATIGLRVPDHPVALALLEELGEPLVSTTLLLPGEEVPMSDGDVIRTRLERQLDLVVDSGPCGSTPTTVIDLSGDSPELLRAGRGPLQPFGLEAP